MSSVSICILEEKKHSEEGSKPRGADHPGSEPDRWIGNTL
jgi:hypothetical protein